MTYSVTITTTLEPTLVVRLSDSGQLTSKIKDLLAKVKTACQTLESHENQQAVLQGINQWEVVFFEKHMIGDRPTDEDRMHASYALCFLYQNLENIMLKLEERRIEKCKWLGLCNELQGILSKTLPSHLDAITLLAQYRKRLAEARDLEEDLSSVDDKYDKAEEALIDKANEIKNNLISNRANLKKEILKLHEERRQSSEAVQVEVDALNQHIQGTIQEIDERLQNVHILGEKMQVQEELLQGYLKDCQQLMNKV